MLFRSAVAALLNLLLLVAVNLWPVWLPLTGGAVTMTFTLTLWAFNLSLLGHIGGNLLLFLASPPWLREAVELVFTGLALVVLLTLTQFYPFNLAVLTGVAVDGLVRVAFGVAALAVAVAMVVHIVRLLFDAVSRPRSA